MSTSDTPVIAADPIRPLYVSIEMAANLVHMARNTQADSEQQRLYLQRALDVLMEMRAHPDLPR